MTDEQYMRLAIRLARKGFGQTSPNPIVGAVIVKAGKLIGRGWHKRAGQPHAEIEALRDAEVNGHSAKGATLYVTLAEKGWGCGGQAITRSRMHATE